MLDGISKFIEIQAKSLNAYRKAFRPRYAIKLFGKNFGMEDGMKSVPLYAAFCI